MSITGTPLILVIVIPILFTILLSATVSLWWFPRRRRQRAARRSQDPVNGTNLATIHPEELHGNTEYMRDKLGRDIQITETVLPLELVDSNDERQSPARQEAQRGTVVVVEEAENRRCR